MMMMKKMISILVMIVITFGVIERTGASSQAKTFWGTNINPNRLDLANKSLETTAMNDVMCAIKASHQNWTDILLCIEEDVCRIYELLVPPNLDEPGDSIECMTTDPPECIYDGETYEHNEWIGSKDLVCRYGSIEKDKNPCGWPFVNDPIFGCVYIHQIKLDFESAAQFCSDYEAQLVVAKDVATFTYLGTFLTNFVIEYDLDETTFWVGVKDRNWLDGRPVEPHPIEWSPYDPNGLLNDCARILPLSGVYYLADQECSAQYYSVCQKSITNT